MIELIIIGYITPAILVLVFIHILCKDIERKSLYSHVTYNTELPVLFYLLFTIISLLTWPYLVFLIYKNNGDIFEKRG